MSKVLLDMNSPLFQDHLLSLNLKELGLFLKSLGKIKKMTWEEVYKNKGLKWECINSQKKYKESSLYSFRFSKKYRATAYRNGDYMLLAGIFPDHDGAYK